MSVIGRLRASTAQAHHDLEEGLDLISRVSDRAGRRALVARFHGLHLGAERALAPLLAGYPGLDFEGRRRAAWLAADLTDLGVDPRETQVCPMPAPGSVAEALGVFYVLEGSTLGGKVIRKAMEAKGADLLGLSFLTPYGEATGERWRAFMALLEGTAPEDADAIVQGGVNGFASARSWLCTDEVAA